MKDHKTQVIPDGEFGMEFADVNGMRLYEIAFMSQKDSRRKPLSKKNQAGH